MLPVFTWPEDPARIELGYEGNRCCANSKLQILMGRRKRTKTEEEERGVLKWGIGKLIAHLPVQPVVVPFWHYGMAAVLQQHNKWEGDTFNNRVISWTDMKGGNSVKVWIGERIFFEDLIIAVSLMRLPQHCAFYKPCEGATHHLLTKTFLAQHEEKHGKLHKVDPEPAGDGIEWEAEITKWRTREQDKALYAAITRRVEESLRALQRRADTDIAKRPDEKLRVSVQIARAKWPGWLRSLCHPPRFHSIWCCAALPRSTWCCAAMHRSKQKRLLAGVLPAVTDRHGTSALDAPAPLAGRKCCGASEKKRVAGRL